jgi:hypothetical protein
MRVKLVGLLILVATLVACNGKSPTEPPTVDAVQPTPTVAPAVTPAPTPVPDTPPHGCGGGNCRS